MINYTDLARRNRIAALEGMTPRSTGVRARRLPVFATRRAARPAMEARQMVPAHAVAMQPRPLFRPARNSAPLILRRPLPSLEKLQTVYSC